MNRTIRRALVATAAFVAIGLAVAFAGTPDGVDPTSQRAAVTAYRTGPLQRLIGQVGSLVVYQIKPAWVDLGHGRTRPDRFRMQAAGWRADIAFAREQFDGCTVPAPLQPAAQLYDRALQQYDDAVQAFVAAAARPAAQRPTAMHAAAVVASGADATWDAADRRLDAVLHHYGIATDRPVTPTAAVGC